MTTLASATLEVARFITNVRQSVATGGSTTTLVDTTFTDATADWTGGTIWFLSGAASGYHASMTYASSTFVFAMVSTAACASSDRYAVAGPDYPKWLLDQSVNMVLRDTVNQFGTYNSTVVTVANQESYTLPTDVANLLSVEIADNLTAPITYTTSNHYWVDYNAGKLYFKGGFIPSADSYIIRLRYIPQAYTDVTSSTATINASYPLSLIAWGGAVHCLRYMYDSQGGMRQSDSVRFNEAVSRFEVERAKFSLNSETPNPQYALW